MNINKLFAYAFRWFRKHQLRVTYYETPALHCNFIFWITFVIFALPSYAIQDGQATISITTLVDYTNSPGESVDVRLLQNGSELTSDVTNEN